MTHSSGETSGVLFSETPNVRHLFLNRKSVNMSKTKKFAQQDLLFRLTAEADEYFRLMGGAGCYAGYRDWHVPALMILLLTGCDPDTPDFLHTEESFQIAPDLWRKTDGLPKKISLKLEGLEFNPELFDEFIHSSTNYICRLHNTRELLGWAEFLTENRYRFQHLL